MALTKSEKDFWVQEIAHEIDNEIANYSTEIGECREMAFEYALKKNNATKEYEECLELYKRLQDIWADYASLKDYFKDVANSLQEKLEGLSFEEPVYYGARVTRNERVTVGYSLPDDTHRYSNYEKDGVFQDSFIERLSNVYLKEVMANRGVTEPLELEELKKKVERGIMLATTSAKLSQFLSKFAEENGLEL